MGNFSPDDRNQLEKDLTEEMTEKEQSTQETILLATIDCINENGIEHLTTRMIAERAGANIASINYYFRTKDQLVNQALKITITHMLEDVIAAIDDESLPFRQKLTDIFYYLISGARNNPGITTAHLYSLVVEKDYESVSAQSFLAAFENIRKRLLENFPQDDPGRLSVVLSTIFSAIMFMMLTPDFFPMDEQYKNRDDQHCRYLAEHFTEMFYAMV